MLDLYEKGNYHLIMTNILENSKELLDDDEVWKFILELTETYRNINSSTGNEREWYVDKYHGLEEYFYLNICVPDKEIDEENIKKIARLLFHLIDKEDCDDLEECLNGDDNYPEHPYSKTHLKEEIEYQRNHPFIKVQDDFIIPRDLLSNLLSKMDYQLVDIFFNRDTTNFVFVLEKEGKKLRITVKQ